MTDDSRLRALKVFLRAYAILSLILFVYRAARDPLAHKMFLDFTAWANVAQGILSSDSREGGA